VDRILITGGSGFLGASLAGRLLSADGTGPKRIVLTDLLEHPRLAGLGRRVDFIRADLADGAACRDLIAPDVACVYHFASLVSGGAEKDFEAGLRANVLATMNLLEACRMGGRCPRFVFTSSIATFGGSNLPEEVDDLAHQHPQNSYGVAKVLGEQLLNDYSRKGFIDGRGVRLPAIVVRDEPNTAASGYASAILREPLAGRDYICPVSPDTRIPILSVGRCIAALRQLGELPPGSLGDWRTINGPSLSPSAREMADAAARHGARGPVRFESDPAIQKMIASWPRRMRALRAAALGLEADRSVDELVRDYVASLGHAKGAMT
jgi:nucleoside-diphosphate-sugar epimerase